VDLFVFLASPSSFKKKKKKKKKPESFSNIHSYLYNTEVGGTLPSEWAFLSSLKILSAIFVNYLSSPLSYCF